MRFGNKARTAAVALVLTLSTTAALAVLAPLASAMAPRPGDDRPTLRDQTTGAGGNVEGCSGSAVSTDENGNVIDSVSGPGGPPASRGNALKVDYDGVVSYDGSTDTLIKNHNWDISIFGVAVKSGGDTNDEERTRDASDEKVSDYIPFRMSGKYYVTFDFSGEGGSCSGSLWVEIDENPVGTIPWIAGTGLILLGIAGLAFSIPSGTAAGAAAAGTGGSAIGGDGAAGGTAGGDPPPGDQVIGGDGGAAGGDSDPVIGG